MTPEGDTLRSAISDSREVDAKARSFGADSSAGSDLPSHSEVTTPRDPAATIVVCPLSQVDRVARVRGVRYLLTLLGDLAQVIEPDGVTAHSIVHINDIVVANGTQILAGLGDVQQIIDFGRSWPRRAPMLIHCLAGISRSTAAAFVIACALQPHRTEASIADELRRASSTASPNRHIVALGDQLLGRGNRMIDAIDAIGFGEPALEGTPFALSVV